MKKQNYSEEYLKTLKIPKHVAVIMDGNGRWAEAKGEPRTYGHTVGSEVVEEMVEIASDLGIKFFTVYAFSTENWKRSEGEVSVLFSLFSVYLKKLIDKSKKNNVRCKIIGDKTMLNDELNDVIDELEDSTKDNSGLTFLIAINYGGRDEITRAVKSVLSDVEKGDLSIDDITEDALTDHLDTKGIPDPDLLIRTGGEQRISNFLLWQCAYSEFYYCDTCWPDFDRDELIKAVEWYNKRDRRFGGVK